MLIALVNNICTWIFICFMTFSTPPTLKNIAPCLIHSQKMILVTFVPYLSFFVPLTSASPHLPIYTEGAYPHSDQTRSAFLPTIQLQLEQSRFATGIRSVSTKLIFVSTGGGVLFYIGVLFSLQNAKFWHFVFFREFMDFLIYRRINCGGVRKLTNISNGPAHNQHTVNKGGLHIYIPITCVAPSSKSIFNSNSSNTDFQPQPARSLVVYFRTAKVPNPSIVV